MLKRRVVTNWGTPHLPMGIEDNSVHAKSTRVLVEILHCKFTFKTVKCLPSVFGQRKDIYASFTVD